MFPALVSSCFGACTTKEYSCQKAPMKGDMIMSKTSTKTTIQNFLKEVTADFVQNGNEATHRLYLGKGTYLYVGILDGYDENDGDIVLLSKHYRGYGLNCGLKKASNELLWCDYEVHENAEGCEDLEIEQSDVDDNFEYLSKILANEFDQIR